MEGEECEKTEETQEMISIPMEEYNQLLIIKGRYEELKEQQTTLKWLTTPQPLTKEYGHNPFKEVYSSDKLPEPPYKITCNNEEEQL